MQDDNIITTGNWDMWFTPPPPPPPTWGWATPPPPPPSDDDGDEKKEEEEVVNPIWSFWRDSTFRSNVKLPEHETDVDEWLFLKLLSGSISLSIDEKKKIVQNFWALSQYQVDELIKIFEEEKSKFSWLDEKHWKQLKILEKQHCSSWDSWELELEQWVESEIEEDQADDIRKNLWL